MEKRAPLFELGPSWEKVLEEELQKPYITQLAAFVERERQKGELVYPPKELVFNTFLRVPYDKVKVVVIGQDPYHGPGQAHGLSFSVANGVPPPPSLKNIYKELASDVDFQIPSHGCLAPWVEQGVMLLNATLTVLQGKPMSHHNRGWEKFTDAVIAKLNERENPLIFVLWGKSAQQKCEHIQNRHTVLKAAHPSPFSAHQGFFGCCHFSKINKKLISQNKEPINWALGKA